MPFAQLVIGPPGSGKTTYCNGMHEFLNGIGRPTIIVNLDPANENIPYECAVNIQDLVSLETVMEEFNLGPNGGMIYCLEYLEKNLDWLKEQLKPYVFADEDNSATNSEGKKPQEYYVLFDCPGQVELYTHHDSVRNITEKLQSWGFRLTSVHLVDAHYCSDASKFISVLLVSLSTMVKLELPHINVLSKVDLIQQYGKLPFDIDYFTDVQDLSYLVRTMEFKGDKTKQLKQEIKEKEHRLKQLEKGPAEDDGEAEDEDVADEDAEEEEEEENEEESTKIRVSPSYKKFVDLNRTLSEVIEDFSLVSFLTLNIQDKQSVYNLLKFIDKSNGYVFGALENLQDITHKMNTGWNYERFDDVRSKYLNNEEEEEEAAEEEPVDQFFTTQDDDEDQSIEDVE